MSDSLLQDFTGTERFTIVRRLGAGGMGVVYEAYDRERRAAVALKTLRWLEAETLYRFKREFRALAEVVHPNLVALDQLFSEGEQWFFTMELVKGCHFLDYFRWQPPAAGSGTDPIADLSWSQVETVAESGGLPASTQPANSAKTSWRPGPLQAEQYDHLRAALLQLTQGLCTLHEAGKLHRDIKPSNVLVTAEGRVVVLDFGLVAELGCRTPASPSGAALAGMSEPTIAGTAAYMSPEQAAAQALSEASDWYCVGAMLYQVLTGRTPFVGSKLRMLTDKQRLEPPCPSELVEGIPEDLDALCRELLRRHPADRPSGPEILRRLGERLPSLSPPLAGEGRRGGPPPRPRTLFVGRGLHLAVLHDALNALGQGRPAIVHVHGRSGAGKSLLVQHFLETVAEQGNAVILAGRCHERESVPYKALDSLMDALSRYLKHLPEAETAALMPQDAPVLARLFPVLGRVEAVASTLLSAALVPDQQELRRRGFAALRELLSRLGERLPLILYIDDLQWGDIDSAALLADLLRPPDPPVLLLLCSFRSEYTESSPCLRILMKAHAHALLDCRSLGVAGLEPAEARELALSLLGAETAECQVQAEAIARESEGSPFFIHELVRHVQEGTGLALGRHLSLDEALWQRVARLPEPARRLLVTVAVSGKPLRQAEAYQAAGPDASQPTILTLLRTGHFVRSTGPNAYDEVEVYHDRVRESVAAHLGPEELRNQHGNLAAVLESSGQADAETVAVHFHEAADFAKAGRYYAVAAAAAAEALAFNHAAKLYRLALELRPQQGEQDHDLHRRLADALAKAGHGTEAAREYQALAARTSGAESLELLGWAGYHFCASGHIDEGRAALATVLNRLGLKLSGTRRKALISLLCNRFRLWLRGLKFRERPAERISAGELARIDISWLAAVGLTMIDTIRGADFQTRNLLLALRAGEPYRLARALAWEAAHVAMSGNPRSARLLQAAEALAQRIGNPHGLGMAAMARGVAAYFHGDWKEARTVCDRAAEIFRNQCTGVAWELDTCNAFAHWALWFLGEWREMISRFPQLVKEAHERGDRLAEANFTTFGGPFVWLAADDPAGARQGLAQAMGEWSQQEFHVQHFTTLTARTQIELYQGDGVAAWEQFVAQWPAMCASVLLRVECVRIFMIHLRGRCALAAAAAAADPRPLLREAAKNARRLEREKVGWAWPLAQLLRASLAVRRGDAAGAAALLGTAAQALEAADMKLFAAAARRRQGELLDGQRGAALREQADQFMAGQKIQDPTRMAKLFVPGF